MKPQTKRLFLPGPLFLAGVLLCLTSLASAQSSTPPGSPQSGSASGQSDAPTIRSPQSNPPDGPPPLVLDSLESLTDRASLVMLATVRDVTPTPPEAFNVPCSAHTIHLEVQRFLKGNAGGGEQAPVLRRVFAFGPPPVVGEDLLVFTRAAPMQRGCGRDTRGGESFVLGAPTDTVLVGAAESPFRMLDRHLRPVEGLVALTETIAQRTRDIGPRWGDAPCRISSTLAASIVPSLSYSGSSGLPDPARSVFLNLPKDSETAQLALQLTVEPAEADRLIGVELLRYFESGENIALLLRLEQKDPSSAVQAAARGVLDLWKVPPRAP
jgi:hypothetical protein